LPAKKAVKKAKKGGGDKNLNDLLHGEYRPDEFMVKLYNRVFLDKPNHQKRDDLKPSEPVNQKGKNTEYRDDSPDNIVGFEMSIPGSVKGGSSNLCGMQTIAKSKSSSKRQKGGMREKLGTNVTGVKPHGGIIFEGTNNPHLPLKTRNFNENGLKNLKEL
jgi:hypothetical protein